MNEIFNTLKYTFTNNKPSGSRHVADQNVVSLTANTDETKKANFDQEIDNLLGSNRPTEKSPIVTV